MQIPGAHIETVAPPQLYSLVQLENAVRTCVLLGRGKFLLCEPPALKEKS